MGIFLFHIKRNVKNQLLVKCQLFKTWNSIRSENQSEHETLYEFLFLNILGNGTFFRPSCSVDALFKCFTN